MLFCWAWPFWQDARERLMKILESGQRTKVSDIRDNYIRAEFTSAVFRFTDDVEFYFQQEQAGEILIHIRSASRIGYSDFGVNRKRIEKIRSQMTGQP